MTFKIALIILISVFLVVCSVILRLDVGWFKDRLPARVGEGHTGSFDENIDCRSCLTSYGSLTQDELLSHFAFSLTYSESNPSGIDTMDVVDDFSQ